MSSYLVLARKYRPQTFSEVVGQEHVTRTLANAFRHGRVHHAFLLCGPRGVGKTTLARILGKALNCEQGSSAEPCGVCDPCAAIASGTAVDYYEMDGASNRGIDAIRDLTEAVKYQPAAMRKKVYVIDEVHMLTTEAFNALLKTLEEPPPHVTFILATTEPHKVPVTILSRCQRYDFKLVPSGRLAAHLRAIFTRESIDVEPAAVDLLVRESGGSVRDALSLADQVISYVGGQEIREGQVAEVLGVADRALVRSLVEALARGDARIALEVVDAAVARGLDEVQVARALARVLHDIAVAQVDAKIIEGSEEEQAELARLGREIEPTRVRLMCDRMMRACEDLAESPEPRIVVDLALIDLAALDDLPPLSELVERLAELERRVAGPGGGGGGGARRAQTRTTARPPAASPRTRSSSAEDEPGAAHAGGEPVAAWSGANGSGAVPTSAGELASSAVPRGPVPSVPSNGPAPSVMPSAQAASMAPSAPAPSVAPAAQAASVAPSSAPSSRPVPRGPVPRGPAAPASSSRPASPSPASPSPAMSSRSAGPSSTPAPSSPGPGPSSSPGPGPSSSPASGPAPSAGQASRVPADALRGWGDVMSALEVARELTLLGWYEHAVVMRWDSQGIELGFPAGAIVADLATEPRNVQALSAFLAQHLGGPIALSVRILSESDRAAADSARSILEAEAERRRDENLRRTDEAREHPVTKMVLDTFFGASIEEIKTDV